MDKIMAKWYLITSSVILISLYLLILDFNVIFAAIIMLSPSILLLGLSYDYRRHHGKN